jgi:hypothetical protein
MSKANKDYVIGDIVDYLVVANKSRTKYNLLDKNNKYKFKKEITSAEMIGYLMLDLKRAKSKIKFSDLAYNTIKEVINEYAKVKQ